MQLSSQELRRSAGSVLKFAVGLLAFTAFWFAVAHAQIGGGGSASYQVAEFGADTTPLTLAPIPAGATTVTLELTLTLDEYVAIYNQPASGQGWLAWETDDGAGSPLPCTLDGGSAFTPLVAECDSANGYAWDLDASRTNYLASTPGSVVIRKNVTPWSTPLDVTFEFLAHDTTILALDPQSAQVFISPLQVADLVVRWK